MALELPQIEINRQTDEHDCSLIVIGSTGGTMAGEILLGGVASAVIHSATRPILLLRLRLKDNVPLVLVAVPAGSFGMGSPIAEPPELFDCVLAG